MRIDEINTRLAEIRNAIDTATGEELTNLETEVAQLTEERQQIMNEVQTRQQLRENIAAGLVSGTVIENTEEENKMENRTFNAGSAEYREAYLMNLQGRTLDAEQRAAVNATAAIPTQTLNRIEAYLEENPILSRIDMTYIPGNVVIPVEGNKGDAAWVEMGAAATDSADSINSISLAAYKLIKTVEITADVEAMVYVMPMTNVLRNDGRNQPFARKDLLEGAPQSTEDSWQVPRLVK